jgi:hypothetical protein
VLRDGTVKFISGCDIECNGSGSWMYGGHSLRA